MDIHAPETQIFLTGCVGLLLMVYAAWMGQMTTRPLPGGYTNPVLALELVEKGEHIKQIKEATNAKGKKAGEFIQGQLKKDYGFIVLYVTLFSSVSLLLSPRSKWAALVGVGCSLLAGIFDLIENRSMTRALRVSAPGDDIANSIRYSSLTKWSLVFVVSILIGATFLLGQKLFSLHSLSFGWLLVLSGAVGLIGVALNLLKQPSARLFFAATAMGALSLICIALLFTFASSTVAKDLYQL